MAAQDTQIESENKDSKEPKNLFAHFTNLLFSAPIFNNKQERNKSEGEEREAAEASRKREVVKFLDPKPIAPPPMKLEVEDSEQNPAARYLVYALGGFLVMRWIWARWQERKERSGKKDSDDKNESSPADEDDSFHSA
ncbi:uncharacterized protein LOC102626912 isoform X2 [Citrus sinensis]|uniref:uncharacterized protein LOC102626912 isoform X2 n=1 Tax=Citrus sinensis TaxID=2711 RepID=UPI0003D76777|nr:uncharacterized protein LOC102626912 isoform X2 [Citrus sinensis]XP_024041038.1 uncharacterized protein LOC18045216 isoform X2 [Citrus x clementina]